MRQAFLARLTRHQTKPDADVAPTEQDQPTAGHMPGSRVDKSILALPNPNG